MNKLYLGDSVYAQDDGFHIVLTTENGLPTDPSNTIALDPYVCDALMAYIVRRNEARDAIRARNQAT
jgi:hypothetical protein